MAGCGSRGLPSCFSGVFDGPDEDLAGRFRINRLVPKGTSKSNSACTPLFVSASRSCRLRPSSKRRTTIICGDREQERNSFVGRSRISLALEQAQRNLQGHGADVAGEHHLTPPAGNSTSRHGIDEPAAVFSALKNANRQRGRERKQTDPEKLQEVCTGVNKEATVQKIYIIDVQSLCYDGSRPAPSVMLEWMALLFKLSKSCPLIAVLDGERGNEYRQALLPGYKSHRRKYSPLDAAGAAATGGARKGVRDVDLRLALPRLRRLFADCNIPVIQVADAEADDVVATLVEQAARQSLRCVVASPDGDMRELLCHPGVDLLLPVELPGGRRHWQLYTAATFEEQYQCSPAAALGLRVLVGDRSDGVEGVRAEVPAFGRGTALKLLRRHGSLEALLAAAQQRTVGRAYVQDALLRCAPLLLRTLNALRLRRDVEGVELRADWHQTPRGTARDVAAMLACHRDLELVRIHGDAPAAPPP
eukprot:jgi/Mesen1/9949/ME000071S09361